MSWSGVDEWSLEVILPRSVPGAATCALESSGPVAVGMDSITQYGVQCDAALFFAVPLSMAWLRLTAVSGRMGPQGLTPTTHAVIQDNLALSV